ncbi:hypothetical protein FOA52_005173 [Chlamydomonas sp. UWO 241]|nr:hypothetical protein FOA52_005173 [Chlamydomonas sp. UWO 241]
MGPCVGRSGGSSAVPQQSCVPQAQLEHDPITVWLAQAHLSTVHGRRLAPMAVPLLNARVHACACVRFAGGPTSGGGPQAQVSALEAERDEALATAESAAASAVKLTDLVAELEALAVRRLKAGDDDSAKTVLREKAVAVKALEKTSAKARANFALAAKLATKIGLCQKALLEPPAPPPPTYSPTGGSGSTAAAPPPSAWDTPPSSSYDGAGSYSSYTPPKPAWQVSIEEARARAASASASAASAGRAARMGAEESIAAARERLRAQGADDTLRERTSRVQAGVGPDASIRAAQERLRAQEAEVLAYVEKIMARYRRGEPVSEEELEFAFAQLERHFQ